MMMKLGISAHVGQTEFEAGVGGGQKMKAAGGKKRYALTTKLVMCFR